MNLNYFLAVLKYKNILLIYNYYAKHPVCLHTYYVYKRKTCMVPFHCCHRDTVYSEIQYSSIIEKEQKEL